METIYVVLTIAILVIIVIAKTATIVPQQSAFVVENLGRYSRTLHAGFHILVPFVERIAYRLNLKEEALDIPEQICITKDNVQVGVDGILYMQVLEANKASYGITNYKFALIQLAQTTLRSEIGKIDLDRTFEERTTINGNVVSELDKASAPWGARVDRPDASWHAWGARSVTALAEAGVALNRPDLVAAARQEADALWAASL